jgi:hypothetical protein
MPKRGLAEAVSEALPPDNGMRVGIVASISPLVVTIQNVPIPDIGGQLNVPVSVGDKVAMVREQGSWLVLGAVLNTAAPAEGGGLADLTDNTVTDSTTSATLVPVVGWGPMNFTRARANSRLDMQVTFGARPTVAVPVSALYGLRFTNPANGATWTPTIMPRATYSTASVHLSHTCRRIQTPAPELGAGDLTVELMWSRVTGTGTLNVASGFDTLGVTVVEL